MFSNLFSRARLRVLFLLIIMLPLLWLGSDHSLSATPTALATQDLNSGFTASDLAQTLVGQGVTVSNVTYTGANRAGGKFSGGTGIIGFEEGIILSSGDIANVVGPNSGDATSKNNGEAGDSDLNTLSGFTTHDAAVLEFDFVPNWDHLYFQFVFASEEYNEFVGSPFNDVFAFFVNGQNCALAQGDPITVNKINNGNPFGIGPNSNPSLYINNDLSDGPPPINTEMDGLTKILTCASEVTPNQSNHIKLVVADASDFIFDTNVFIEANSFTTDPPTIDVTPQTSSLCIPDQQPITAVLSDNEGNAVENVSVNFEVISGPHAGTTSSAQSNASGQATFTYNGSSTGTDIIEANFKDALDNTITSAPVSMGWLAAEDCLPPEDAIELHAMASEESVNTNWDLVAPLSGDLDHYELYRNGSSIHSGTNSQYTDNNVASDVEYCYQVKAFESGGSVIGSSNEACVTVGSLTIWVPHQVVPPNAADVPITVNLANGNGLCVRALDIKVEYDETIVEVTEDVQNTIFTAGYAFEANTTAPGEVKISAIIGGGACQELFGGGSLFDIFFNAIGNEGDVSTLEFIEGLTATVIYDDDNLITPVPLIQQDGSVTIGFTLIRGDINGDGFVNAADAALALDISSGIVIPTPEQLAACDVNGDNACNAADSSLILCYAAFQDWGQCGGVESSNHLRHAALVNPNAPVQVKINDPAQSGQSASFPVSVSNAADLAGANFTFAYDASKMTATGASLTSLTNGFEIEVNTTQAGLLQLSLASQTSIGADGAIFNIEFTTTSGLSSIDFGSVSLSDASGRDFETSALQREIQLVPYQAPDCVLVGDFDNDGDVDITDVQAVAFRWNTTVGDENYDALYDLDNDGDIDITDVQTVAFNWNSSCPSAATTAANTHAARRRANVPQAVSLALDPAGMSAAAGQSFTVDVVGTGVENLGGFEFTLTYDSSLMELNSASLNDSFLGSTGRTFSATTPSNDSATGTVSYGAFSLGTTPGPDGDGVLATFTFTMLTDGINNIQFSNAQVTTITGSTQEITEMTSAWVNLPPTAIQLAQIESVEKGFSLPWLLGVVVSGLALFWMPRRLTKKAKGKK